MVSSIKELINIDGYFKSFFNREESLPQTKQSVVQTNERVLRILIQQISQKGVKCKCKSKVLEKRPR